jgi:hypothetical protein
MQWPTVPPISGLISHILVAGAAPSGFGCPCVIWASVDVGAFGEALVVFLDVFGCGHVSGSDGVCFGEEVVGCGDELCESVSISSDFVGGEDCCGGGVAYAASDFGASGACWVAVA